MDLKAKQRMFEKYKFMLNKRAEEINEKHFVEGNRELGLRCFNFRREKGSEKDRILRCVNGAVAGSIFCKDHDFDRTMVTSKRQLPQVFDNKLHNLFEAYLNDATMLDHKQDLAILRTLLTGYIKKLTNPDKLEVDGFLARLRLALQDDSNSYLTYEAVMDIFYKHDDIFSSKSIKNINETIKNIGTSLDRINRINTGDQFILTPEGLNVLFRSLVEILKRNVKNKDTMLQIQTDLMTISVATKGNLQLANDKYLEKRNEESKE